MNKLFKRTFCLFSRRVTIATESSEPSDRTIRERYRFERSIRHVRFLFPCLFFVCLTNKMYTNTWYAVFLSQCVAGFETVDDRARRFASTADSSATEHRIAPRYTWESSVRKLCYNFNNRLVVCSYSHRRRDELRGALEDERAATTAALTRCEKIDDEYQLALAATHEAEVFCVMYLWDIV